MPFDTLVYNEIDQLIKNKKNQSAFKKLISISNYASRQYEYLKLMKIVLKELGDYSALIKTLKAIQNYFPSFQNQIELMETLYLNAQINEALDIGLALQEQELDQISEKSLLHLMVKIFIEENDFEGVYESMQNSKFNHEKDDFLNWALGLVYLARQDHNLALSFFRKAVNLNPKNDQAWVSLGLLHHQMGDAELSVANIETAIDCNPFNSAAIKQYAQLAMSDVEKSDKVLKSIRYYLSEHDFDEDISLCHIQALCRSNSWKLASYEIDKLILTHPQNQNYYELKKNLLQNVNI